MSDEYTRLHRAVLAVLAEADPIGLADPDISLAEEYEAEAREIARRVLGAPGGSVGPGAVIQEVFVRQCGARISDDVVSAITRVLVSGRSRRTIETSAVVEAACKVPMTWAPQGDVAAVDQADEPVPLDGCA